MAHEYTYIHLFVLLTERGLNEMVLQKPGRNNDEEEITDLGSQTFVPTKGTRLPGEMNDCRTQGKS